MDEAALRRIESTLGVSLPEDYRNFLQQSPQDEIDDTTVLRDPEAIIAATMEYRSGFSGLKPWRPTFLYLGHESDACPYAIDCASGVIQQTDKGNFERAPLARWSSFREFAAQQVQAYHTEVSPEQQRKNSVIFYAPLVIGLLVIFIVIPAIAMGISSLFKWLFK